MSRSTATTAGGAPTKMKINKACDLSSISVLPPHSRRTNPSLQLWSQSQSQQSSFSQGNSLSQFSQTSIEENLTNDQRFDSQEREKSSRRISSLLPVVTNRDESQLQLSRTSNSIVRRWGPASAPGSGCLITEELENRFRHMESSLNRQGMILDTVQSDVMQVNRAVKELALETESVRQKIALLDNSMQQMVKEEQELKAILDASLKAIPNQILDSDRKKLNEITSIISILPKQIEAYFVKFQHEVSTSITKRIEVITNGTKSSSFIRPEPIQSPMSKCYTATRQSLKSQRQNPMLPPAGHPRIGSFSKIEAEIPKTLKPKLTGSNCNIALKKEETALVPQGKDFRIIIDSDEESDVGLSRLLVKKETGKSACSIDDEAREETIRILREARRRKRKRSNCVILD